jgi:hypothetical protein
MTTAPWISGFTFRARQLCVITKVSGEELHIPVSRCTPDEIQQAIAAHEGKGGAAVGEWAEAQGRPA